MGTKMGLIASGGMRWGGLDQGRCAPWLLAVAMLGLYGPTVWTLSGGLWTQDRQSHGPVLLAVAVWLFWHRLRQLPIHLANPLHARPGWGWPVLLLGLVLHAVGRSQAFATLEVLSVVPVTVAISLLCGGPALVRGLAFCHLFLLFLVPVPDQLADIATQPLKLAVSAVAEHLLAWSGYAVARSGVVLVLPPYKLLVADACSGMSSLFMLEAFGLLYLNVVRHTSVLRNVALSLMIIPISFSANVVRVLFLAVLTHHLGDAVAGGIVHSLSGLILFVPAFAFTVGLDGLLRRWVRARMPAARAAGRAEAAGPVRVNAGVAVMVLLAALLGGGLTVLITPPVLATGSGAPGLAQAIPARLGPWARIEAPVQVNTAVSMPGARTEEQPYDEVVMRTYRNGQGQQVMLAVAYAYQLQQSVKIHRPEVCYAAQGFEVRGLTSVRVPFAAKSMVAIRRGLEEQVLYWIRVGPTHSDNVFQSRWTILSRGLRGQSTDGVLVRVSAFRQPGEAPGAVRQRLVDFVADLREATRQPGASPADLLW